MRFSQQHNNERPRNQRPPRPGQNNARRPRGAYDERPDNMSRRPQGPGRARRPMPMEANEMNRPRRSGTLDLPEREKQKQRNRNRRKSRPAQQVDPRMLYEEDRRPFAKNRGPQGGPPPQRPYRNDDSRENYSRSSGRYARNASMQGRAMPPNNMANQQRHPARDMQDHMPTQANQYSRDRYLRQPGQQHAMPVNQQKYEKARFIKPINPKILLGLGIVVIVLVAVIVLRFVLVAPRATEFETIQANIRQEQTTLDELNKANEETQSQIDSWQSTIEQYKALKK